MNPVYWRTETKFNVTSWAGGISIQIVTCKSSYLQYCGQNALVLVLFVSGYMDRTQMNKHFCLCCEYLGIPDISEKTSEIKVAIINKYKN